MGLEGAAGPEGFPPARIASTVTNPLNGEGISGAQIQVLRRGVVVGSAVADARGDFSLDAPPGLVQILANASGFMRFSRYTLLLPRLNDHEKVFLPPIMPQGSISFVLIWDKTIADMDLHIMTPWGCQAGWTNKLCNSGSYQARHEAWSVFLRDFLIGSALHGRRSTFMWMTHAAAGRRH